ncbi:MAG: ABC transporter ATP-binding protein [Acidimicrobiia bacterium]
MTTQQTPPFREVIWALIRRQPFRYSVALVLWVSVWTMPIFVGLLIGYFFNQLAAGIEPTTVTTIVLALAAYTLARTAFIFLAMRNHGSMLFRAAALMRRNLLLRLYELPGAESLDETPGEIVSRLRDDVEHVVEPFDLTVDLAGAVVAGLVSFGLLFSIDPVITVVVAIPVVIVAFVSHTTGGMVRRYRRQAREATESITGFLGETFSATQSVKVAGAEQPMLERFVALNSERKEMMVKDRTLTEALHAVFRNTVNIGTGLILLLAAGRLSATGDAGISIGEFALFVFLLHHVTDASYFIGVFTARAKQGSVSIERLTKTLHGEPWERVFVETDTGLDGDPAQRTEPLPEPPDFDRLSVRGLSYTYPGSVNGIEDFDLDIARGEFVVITGRIGSGKTTAVRTVLGLLPADSGTIEWNGTEVHDASGMLVPPHAAYTPQVPKLFSMSLRDNLILGEEVTDHVVNESIYIATMRHDVDQMSEGLETMVGPRGVRLSGGQIQRSASARMLTRDPQLLVLDDVSSALDVETEQILWTRLFNARADVAALVVSHRHAALARADRVIVMDAGRIVASGPAAELQETSAVFRAIWEGATQATTPA